VRWMCSFDATVEDVKDFARGVAEAVKGWRTLAGKSRFLAR